MVHFNSATDKHPLIGPDPGHDVAQFLTQRGALSESQLAHISNLSADWHHPPDLVAISQGLVTPAQARAALATLLGAQDFDENKFIDVTPELDGVPPEALIHAGVLPCRLADGERYLIMSRPLREAPDWLDLFATWPVAIAERTVVQDILAQHCKDALVTRAETRVADLYSCRNWGRRKYTRMMLLSLVVLGLVSLVVIFPLNAFVGLIYWSIIILTLSFALKCSAILAHLFSRSRREPPLYRDTSSLPQVSIMVPLFREHQILPALVERLAKLTYPRALLDVILVVEEKDQDTLDALGTIDLPDWMRTIIVPDAQLKTKPRAMNYALDFCQGEIIGIYDAEDAPEPDQLEKVVEKFCTSPREMACLQGILDFYNPRQNLLSRCFTVEYATWFRLVLPGFVRLGLAIPLGGTTFFIRRDVLEEVGAWDAHNVTEDADLGFRLRRLGYRSEMIDCITYEEANCRPWPWIRQRSRWLKGYLMTYLVHMRTPSQLRRDLGWWPYLGFHAHFLSALFQFLLAPVMWSFWLVVLGFNHPLSGIWAESTFVALGMLFLVAEGVTLFAYLLAVSAPRLTHLIKFTPLMHLYWPLCFFAICKSLIEFIRQPFFWDKTTHGVSPEETPLLKSPPLGIPQFKTRDESL